MEDVMKQESDQKPDGSGQYSTEPATDPVYASPNEYLRVLAALKMIAAAMYKLPVAEALNMLTRAETLGPILDPTLYVKTREKTGKTRRQLEALLELQKALMAEAAEAQ